nr:ATP-binding protein [Thermoleophilaceae bacterium]
MGAATEAGRNVGLFERERELEVVERALAGVGEGSGRLVLVSGPAGIGKTRVLRAAEVLTEKSGLGLLRARGGDLEREFPFGVMRQLLEPAIRTASADERRELLSGPAELASELLLGGASTEAEPAALDHALYWLVANLADRAPLALSVDDLHWADGPSLRALVHLVRRLD